MKLPCSIFLLIGSLAVLPGLRAVTLTLDDSYFVGTITAQMTAGSEATHLGSLIALPPGHSESVPGTASYQRSFGLISDLPQPGSLLPTISYDHAGFSIDGIGYLLASASSPGARREVWSVWYVNGLSSPATFGGFLPHSVIRFTSAPQNPLSSTLTNESESWGEFQRFMSGEPQSGFVLGVPETGNTIGLLFGALLVAHWFRQAKS